MRSHSGITEQQTQKARRGLNLPGHVFVAERYIILPSLMVLVSFLCQEMSLHIPTNCGAQKLLVAIPAQQPVDEAASVPNRLMDLTQSQFRRGQSL